MLGGVSPGGSVTEFLLTSPEAFAITSATPAQRAICRILDGVPLAELLSHPDVIALIGGERALATLPSESGHKPSEVCILAAIRAAKTIIACCAAVRMALTVDVSAVLPGETVRVSLVSLKLEIARVAHRLLAVTLEKSKALRGLLAREPAGDSLWIVHPSGRTVEVRVTAGSKAGGGLVADWSAGAVFDEAPRMDGASEAVVNLDDARTAVLGRLLPGAQALYIGSPWAPFGPVFDMVQEGEGKPSGARVVLRGTGPMLNPTWWTPERCDDLRKRDPVAYQTDVLGEFATPDSGLVNPEAQKRNTRRTPGDLPMVLHGRYAAALDPSEGSQHGNPWTLVIVQREQRAMPASKPDGSPLFDQQGNRATRPGPYIRVACVREYRGMRPEQVLEDVARVCRGYGLTKATTDQYAGAANADLAKRYGLLLDVVPWTGPRKVQAYTNLATLVETDAIELHADPQFGRDLASVRKRTTQQGVAIDLPRMGGGRHCDYAPSVAAAVEQVSLVPWSTSTLNVRGL